MRETAVRNSSFASLGKDNYKPYLNDIRNSGKLTARVEKILAERIRQGDVRALRALVAANLKFVVLVCRRYEKQGLPMPDLIGEGNLGLVQAARRFDGRRDLKFISYAVWWIRRGILDALSRQTRSVTVPPGSGGALHSIYKANRRLEQKLGRQPTPEELELESGIHARRIREYLRADAPALSLDYSSPHDGGPGLHGMLADASDDGPERRLERTHAKEMSDLLLNKLAGKEKEVLTLYFGTRNGHPMSLEGISDRLRLSKERIRQIRNQGLIKLRKAAAKLA